jgi:hypothetical protein
MKKLAQAALRIVRLLDRKLTFTNQLPKGLVSNLYIVNEHLALAVYFRNKSKDNYTYMLVAMLHNGNPQGSKSNVYLYDR